MDRIRKYKTDVGVSTPYAKVDDVIEIELPISDNEINAIIDGNLSLYWVRNAIDTWEYIETFAPEAYRRGIVLAGMACKSKRQDYNSKTPCEFRFYLPNEIINMMYSSAGWREENRIRHLQQEISRKQFHEDGKLLYEAYKEGRFKDRLTGIPQWGNKIFDGVWFEELHDYAATYYICTSVLIKGREFQVTYDKIYKRDSIEMTISTEYQEDKITKISDGGSSDVEFFMEYLDKLIRE